MEDRDIDSMLCGVCPDTHLDVEGDADQLRHLAQLPRVEVDDGQPQHIGVSLADQLPDPASHDLGDQAAQ